jgi:hypothetical protein
MTTALPDDYETSIQRRLIQLALVEDQDEGYWDEKEVG